MKLHKKILSAFLISGCFLNQESAYASPFNAYVGGSTGFQRGWGSLNGGTFADGITGGFRGLATVPYSGRIGQSDPVGNVFFEVDAKITNCFSIGLRPYYHLNSFEAIVTRNGNLNAFEPNFSETIDFSVQRRHAYGLLFVPKMSFKEVTFYGLLGAEFSRFKAKTNRKMIDDLGTSIASLSLSKGVSSSAAVIGLGVSRELGNWSLFAEGQYKHYQVKKFEEAFATEGVPTSQFLKFSPKFASVMFGVKYKIC